MRVPTRNIRQPKAPRDVSPQSGSKRDAVPHDAELDFELEDRPRREARLLPMVAIVGRPNVGKSTLFNRILGRRKAVVHDRPGVTRDRNIDETEWEGTAFLCVDTGGFETELDDPLLTGVVEQVRIAIDDADVIIFLTAVGEADHPAEREIVRLLRTSRKPVIVAVNKADTPKMELEANEFFRFGFDRIHPISSLHGIGVGDLLSEVVLMLRAVPEPPSHPFGGDAGIRLALVGRQNVGKSTLVNRLAGATRVIASELPGTTRDSIDTVMQAPGGRIFTLIDTAGIRRRGKVEVGIEKMSVLSSFMSMRRADVAALMLDAVQGITEQDAHIAGYCLDAGLALVILVNKWDAANKDHKTADQFTKNLEREWPFVRYAPVLYVSGLSGQRTSRIFEVVERVYTNACRRIGTHELNERIVEWVGQRPPTMARNRRPKVRFLTQTGVQPPTFTLFVNDPLLFHFSYKRYIMNRLREAYDFEGTPIRLEIRQNKKTRGDEPENPALDV